MIPKSKRLSRRTFVAGLGAAAVAPCLARAELGAFAGPDDIRHRIIDSANDLTNRAEAIRLSGVRTVIRYYARGGGQWNGKVLTRTELDALEAQNLSVAAVFQHANNKPENFLDEHKRIDDAMWARTHADHLRQPEGTPIYFGADFELRHWDSKAGRSDPSTTGQRTAAVHRYFEYIRDELAKDGRKLGVYGCGSTLELLSDVADYLWLSASADYWHSDRFFNSGRWHLFQNRVDLVRHYDHPLPCPIDTNLANPQHAEFGQWRRSGKVDRDTPDETRAVLDARSFVAVQQLVLYRDHPRRDPALLKPEALTPSERAALRYAFNVKIVAEDAEFYGVSLDEGETVRGWCHRSDLAADGSMPLRARRALAAKSAALVPNALAARPTPAAYRVADAGGTPVALTPSVPLPPNRPVPLPRNRPARLIRAN